MPRLQASNAPPHDDELLGIILACQADAGFCDEIQAIYGQVDGELASLGVTCMGGGACCKFDLAGHRLYVSAGELAVLTKSALPDISRCHNLRCPYQVGPRCYARQNRPLGCRTYFCRAGTNSLPQELYERFHQQIKNAHQRHRLAYRYVELTQAFRSCFA